MDYFQAQVELTKSVAKDVKKALQKAYPGVHVRASHTGKGSLAAYRALLARFPNGRCVDITLGPDVLTVSSARGDHAERDGLNYFPGVAGSGAASWVVDRCRHHSRPTPSVGWQ